MYYSKDDEIAKLKAQLAAAESKAKKDKDAKAEKPEHEAHEEKKHEHLTGLAKVCVYMFACVCDARKTESVVPPIEGEGFDR